MTEEAGTATIPGHAPLPRLRRYSCNACGEADCECFTETDIPPTRCCMQFIPSWREGP